MTRAVTRAVAKTALAAAALLGLAACGRPDPAAVRAALVSADYSKAEQPLLLAEYEASGVVGLLGKTGRNGDVETWQSPDGVSLSLDRGVLVRNAGSGRGILISDATHTRAALTGQGPREYQRLYKFLTGENQVAEMLFNCRMSGPTAEQVSRPGGTSSANRWTEACSTGSTAMANDYWTAAGADVVKSRQWIDAVAGYVVTEVPVGGPR